jgi:hypothetical protein
MDQARYAGGCALGNPAGASYCQAKRQLQGGIFDSTPAGQAAKRTRPSATSAAMTDQVYDNGSNDREAASALMPSSR